MTTTFHDTIFTTSKSSWSRVRKYKALVQSKILRWFFCVDDAMLEEIKQESELRDSIREAMVIHNGGTGPTAVIKCMKEIYNETGHDMSNIAETVEGLRAEAETPVQFYESLGALGLVDNNNTEQPTQVRVVPKFAASVVLCLRAKFGNLALTEANRLLIEREYLKVCRESTVRNVDSVAHQQCIMNAYFTEGVLDEQCTVRARAPRWLREAFGSVPRVSPSVC